MPDLVLLFLTIPVVTAFVGWVTNWAAVKMIFHPENFLGIGPLGWQAILVRRSHKFAEGAAEMATENLVSARDIASKFDPDEVEKLFAETLDEQTDLICEEAADVIRPGAWEELPEHVRVMVTAQVRQETGKISRELFGKLQGVSDELLDLKGLIYGELSGKNVRKLVRLTKQIGRHEWKFIEYYGAVFGFIVGLLQAAVWTSFHQWWLMPFVGAAVGLGTNWLAIQMIFRPQEPTRYFGLVTYQGLFPKRQKEIAYDYGYTMADEIITPKNLIRLVTEGEAGQRIAEIVTDTIAERLTEEWKKFETMMPVEVTPRVLSRVTAIIVRRIVETVPEIAPEIEAYLQRKLDIGKSVEAKLAALPKPKFERLLRGIFEEDEIILILVGGFLGFGVGCLQASLVLAIY
jgi:uncharacterized membrane protein YheB (UPF0754 family)